MTTINKTKRILLVEDDSTMRSLLTTLLTLEKHEVFSIDSFHNHNIIDALTQNSPDLVIMDYSLKSTNGLSVLSDIRSNPDFESTQILMVSGYDISRECQEAGANGFLLKPYMPSELIAWINQHQG